MSPHVMFFKGTLKRNNDLVYVEELLSENFNALRTLMIFTYYKFIIIREH